MRIPKPVSISRGISETTTGRLYHLIPHITLVVDETTDFIFPLHMKETKKPATKDITTKLLMKMLT